MKTTKSFLLESEFFRAGLERLASLESDDLGVRFAAELRVEQLQQLREKMNNQGRATGHPDLKKKREGIES